MSIYKKIAALTSIICMGLGLGAALLVSQAMRGELERDLGARGKAITMALSDGHLERIISGDPIEAFNAARKTAEDFEEVAYVFIEDFNGRVFAHSFEGGFPVQLRAAVSSATGAGEFSRVEFETSIGRICDISRSLIEGTAARLHIGLKLSVIDDHLLSLQIQILLLTIGITLTAAAVTYFMSQRITGPLRRVVQMMSDYGQGQELPTEALDDHGGGEEVTAVRSSFKEMIERRKDAEFDLRESEERYARAVAGANDGIWDWNIETGEAYFSPRWEEIVGRERGEIEPVMQSFKDLIYPDDGDQVAAAVRDHLENRVPYDIEFRLRRKGGDYVWVRSRAQAVWDSDGEPLRMAGSITDITERKHVETEISKLNERLEQRVEERTAELRAAQDALLRQERLAALGQLTGTVAHEIRNPLGAIANSISVIKHKCSKADLDLGTTLDRTDRSIKRCDRIITELLDFARAKGLQPQPMALDTWLSEIVKEQHIPEGISVNSNLHANGVAVRFDPDELRRAVINVIDNACQAMVDGNGENESKAGGELTVASRLSGERVEIEFADNGPGIPGDILPQVLEPLFSTKSFGTGLGLSTVQRIMEEHGGGLEISSEDGRGTRVVLWLPPRDGSEGIPRG